MALRTVRARIKNIAGQCDSACVDCATVQGVVPRNFTVDNIGILAGRIAPNSQGNLVWQEGEECFANFEFDDVQLADPSTTVVRTCDICIVCGCIVDFVLRSLERDTVIDCGDVRACISVEDTDTVDHSFINGVIRSDVKISALPQNAVQVVGDGLFVNNFDCTDARACISVADTNTVDLNYNLFTGLIESNVRLSIVANNQIQALADGLYVAPFGCLEARACLQSLNTPSIQSIYLPASGTIAANLIVSNAPGNQLTINSDGAFVPPVSCNVVRACLFGGGSPSTNVIFNTGTGTITADVRIDPSPGNQLILTSGGLFVPPAGPAAPTPTLTDNGNRTFTFNNGVNPPVTFCSGFDSLDQGTGCESVGTGFMVRSVNLNGCQLRVTAAPEHTTVGSVTPFGVGNAIDDRQGYLFDPVLGSGISFDGPGAEVFFLPESAVGVVTPGCQQIPLVINNPSPCRNLLVSGIIEVRLTWNVRGFAAGTFYTSNFTFGISLDGAPYQDVKTYPFRNFEGEAGASGVMSRIQTYMTFQKIIPPGGNLVVRSRVRINVDNHSAFAGPANPASTEITGSSIRGHWWGSTV